MRYFLSILIGLGLIVLVIVLIVKGLSGGKHQIQKQIDLVNYANTDNVAQLIIDAPVNNDQEHRTVKISVSQNQTKLDVIQGYQGNVIKSQTYPNNQSAYAVFLRSLQHYGFNEGDNSKSKQDERGFCPLGNRYIYSFGNDSNTLMRFWSTSCGGQGTFGGNSQTVRMLFSRQIPGGDFVRLTNGVPLGG